MKRSGISQKPGDLSDRKIVLEPHSQEKALGRGKIGKAVLECDGEISAPELLVGSEGGVRDRLGIVDPFGHQLGEAPSHGLVHCPRGCRSPEPTVAVAEKVDAKPPTHHDEPGREPGPRILGVLSQPAVMILVKLFEQVRIGVHRAIMLMSDTACGVKQQRAEAGNEAGPGGFPGGRIRSLQEIQEFLRRSGHGPWQVP
jgi:hypothetical protein